MRLTFSNLLIVFFLLGCKSEETFDSNQTLLAEIPTAIKSVKISTSSDKVYLGTYYDTGTLPATTSEIYSLELANLKLTKLVTVNGNAADGFIVSSDEKFVILTNYIQKSNGFESRIEKHNLESNTMEILSSSTETSYFGNYGLDSDNKFLLYNSYKNGKNIIRKRDLLSGDDIQLSGDENAVFIGIHPITHDILVDTYSEFYFMDWNGVLKTSPVSGLTPVSISFDGTILCRKGGAIYLYTSIGEEKIVASVENESLLPCCFSGAGTSILFSTDKDNKNNSFLYELYTIDSSGENMKRYTFNNEAEFPIGFYESDTKILFTTNKNDKGLFSINL